MLMQLSCQVGESGSRWARPAHCSPRHSQREGALSDKGFAWTLKPDTAAVPGHSVHDTASTTVTFFVGTQALASAERQWAGAESRGRLSYKIDAARRANFLPEMSFQTKALARKSHPRCESRRQPGSS